MRTPKTYWRWFRLEWNRRRHEREYYRVPLVVREGSTIFAHPALIPQLTSGRLTEPPPDYHGFVGWLGGNRKQRRAMLSHKRKIGVNGLLLSKASSHTKAASLSGGALQIISDPRLFRIEWRWVRR